MMFTKPQMNQILNEKTLNDFEDKGIRPFSVNIYYVENKR